MTVRRSLPAALALALLTGAAASAFAQMPPRPGVPAAPPASTPGTPPDTAVFERGGPGPVDMETLERSQRQINGEFGPLDRQLGIPLGMTQDAWSAPFRHMAPGQNAPGVVRFQWSPDLVMPVRIRDAMVTMLILPDWEEATSVYMGDAHFMRGHVVRPNVVAIRSSQSGIDTSLTIVGKSGNLYTFYVRAESYNTKKTTDINVFVEAPPSQSGGDIWFRGSDHGRPFQSGHALSAAPTFPSASFAPPVPGPSAPALFPAPTVPGTLPAGADSISAPDSVSNGAMVVPRDQMIFNMTMYELNAGDSAIAPDFVYTDGVWTYFHYASKARSVDRPVVYRVVDGVESRVNTRTAGRFGEVIIAEALGDFVLRNGTKVVCVKRAGEQSTNAPKAAVPNAGAPAAAP